MKQINNFFKDKKVLITGHTGFKGSWLTQTLLLLGAKIIGYSLEPNTNPSLFNILELKDKINNYFEDIRDYNKLKEIIINEKPEIIFHLAAQPLVRDSYDDPINTYNTNIIGTANILQAIKEVNCVKSCVLITTDKVYENKEWLWPYRENDTIGSNPDPYSTSKACAELIIESYQKSFFNINNYETEHSTLIASVRAGNVIGGGDWAKDRLITDIVQNINTENSIILRNPNAIRPWQHVLEPLSGYMQLSKKLYEKEIECSTSFNFGPNEKNFITVENLVKKAIKYFNKGEYQIIPDNQKHEAKLLKLDSTKSKELLNWNSKLTSEETFKWTFEWYHKFYNNENIVDFTKKQILDFINR